MQNHGQEYGYSLTIERSIPFLEQLYYFCDRESYQIRRSKPLSYVPVDRRKRKRTVLQTQYQYEVYIWFTARRRAWPVSESQSHDHEPVLSAAVHAAHRGLRPGEKTDVITLGTGLKRPRISRLPKEENPDDISIVNGISNAIATTKRGELDGLANIEAAVERLRNLNLRCRFKEDGASGAVTDLIFTPRKGYNCGSAFLHRLHL